MAGADSSTVIHISTTESTVKVPSNDGCEIASTADEKIENKIEILKLEQESNEKLVYKRVNNSNNYKYDSYFNKRNSYYPNYDSEYYRNNL